MYFYQIILGLGSKHSGYGHMMMPFIKCTTSILHGYNLVLVTSKSEEVIRNISVYMNIEKVNKISKRHGRIKIGCSFTNLERKDESLLTFETIQRPYNITNQLRVGIN